MANGILAGASLDQSIKQLPSREKIGAVRYSEYSRAADLAAFEIMPKDVTVMVAWRDSSAMSPWVRLMQRDRMFFIERLGFTCGDVVEALTITWSCLPRCHVPTSTMISPSRSILLPAAATQPSDLRLGEPGCRPDGSGRRCGSRVDHRSRTNQACHWRCFLSLRT